MERIAMSERAEALAMRFEAVRDEFLAFARELTPQQWSREVPEENPTIAAMVHHIAWSYEVETAAFRAMAEGRPFQAWTDETLAQANQINAEISETRTMKRRFAISNQVARKRRRSSGALPIRSSTGEERS
jgi:hypothetical protein